MRWQVWIGYRVSLALDGFYEAFKTREEAVACRDDYNEYSDETYAYIIYDNGD
jgi:hypothetical protein